MYLLKSLTHATLPSEEARPAECEHKLDLLLAITLCGFVFSVAFYYFCGLYRGADYPYNTFLFHPWVHYNDFTNPVQESVDLNEAAQKSLYLPFASLYFHLFGLVPLLVAKAIYFAIPAVTLICAALSTMQGSRTVRKVSYLTGVFFISYPVLFAFDRGNLELHVFAGATIFLLLYQRTDRLSQICAALALAVPIAFKAYPILLAALYLKDRRIKELVLVFGLTAALTLSGILATGRTLPTIVQGFLQNVRSAAEVDLLIGARFNLGLCNAVRFILTRLHAEKAAQVFEHFYLFLSLGLLAAIGVAVLLRRLQLWQSATVLAAAMCLVPKLSYDYKLLLLLPPLCLFIRSVIVWNRLNLTICWLFGLLLIPKGHIILAYELQTAWGPAPVSVASFLNPAILLLLLVLSLLPQPRPPKPTNSIRHEVVSQPA